MTMKGRPDIYAEKSSPATDDKKIKDSPSGDDSEGFPSPARTGSESLTGSDCELRSSGSSGSCSDEDPNTFEGLLKICGDGGPWQLQIFLLTSFVGFCTALHNLVYAFIGATPDHWCHLPNVTNKYSETELKDLLIQSHPGKNNKKVYDSCQTYAYSWNETANDFNINRNQFRGCDNIDFDNSTFKNTIVTDWQLVCNDTSTFWASAVQATYMFGILCGSPVFGAVSDKLGRKKAILIATTIFVISGPLVALSPAFYVVMITRFLLAFGSPGIYGTSFVLAIEIMGPSWRGLAGNLFCLPFALGYMVLPGVAYFIRDWKTLQLVLSAPSLLLFVTWYFLPESPRWLLRKGRVQEAEAILRSVAEKNGRKKHLPVDFGDMVAKIGENEKESTVNVTWKKKVTSVLSGYTRLFKTPKMRVRTLVIYVCWASISLTYYGIALNSQNLSTNLYLYIFIGGVLEVPSYFMVPPMIRLLGRKPAFSGFLLVCSAALFSSLLLEEGSPYIVALSQFGKFVIGGAYALVYLYATELMPTLLRTYGLGTSSMAGRVGSIVAPFIVDLVGRNNKTYPSVVFGCVSLTAGVLSLLLPETRNRRLPETVEDVELGRV